MLYIQAENKKMARQVTRYAFPTTTHASFYGRIKTEPLLENHEGRGYVMVDSIMVATNPRQYQDIPHPFVPYRTRKEKLEKLLS